MVLAAGDGVDSDSDDEQKGRAVAARAAMASAPQGSETQMPQTGAAQATSSATTGAKASVNLTRRSQGDALKTISDRLDRFFGDPNLQDLIERELANASRSVVKPGLSYLAGAYGKFRINVPQPYPGVQFRNSKRMEDKHDDFIERDSIVEGEVDKDGAWLQVGPGKFLPMRVDSLGLQILEPVELVPLMPEKDPRWWACCTGNAEQIAQPALVAELASSPMALAQTAKAVAAEAVAEATQSQGPAVRGKPSGAATSIDSQKYRSSSSIDQVEPDPLPTHLTVPISPFADT